ncbi:hypothetical protein GQ44DRAFT_619589 [Phaeosphaeriaceae sp. PMI808]|nr:hypothetical protein GQ44DRAFT_619589 [Phaeosphaeriaceae sp. PMI808]
MRTKVTQKTSVEQEEHYQVNESTDPYFLDPANFLDGELWEVVEIDPNDFFGQSINEKFKAANAIIAEQNKSDDPAGKMGQNIHIINADGRIKIEGVYWQSPQDDPSIPTTPAHRALRQQQILAALRNNKHCKEVATTKEFLNRWGADSAHFSDAELEDCAWDIVDACVDTHTHGWTKKILDVSLRESFQKTMFCTFDERMYGVIRTLMYAKRTCADILKQERFWTTLGNPFELDARTASNARSNRQKQMLIKKRTLEVAEGAGAGEGEGEGEGVGGRPKKRARASRL